MVTFRLKSESLGIVLCPIVKGVQTNPLFLSILLTGPPSVDKPNELAIVEWENSQYGHRAYDLGRIIGDLCGRGYLDKAGGVGWIIEGFVLGYGELSEDLAFRTAIHAGVYFVNMYMQRSPTADPSVTPDTIEDYLTMGRAMITNGWLEDREYFKGTPLAALFMD